ncbi:MAG: nickel transporter [Methylococcaceae bacterium]|nr:nickel transporter [Methylococcaceae bacterium]
MYIIPVLDLKDGCVVHAKQGQREQYAPVRSPLCQSADLEKVMAAYLNLHPFTTFYIADLNAIAGRGDHQTLLNQLLSKFPSLEFWIDSGFQSTPSLYYQHDNYVPVLGSESYTNANCSTLLTFQQKYILSLDFAATLNLGAEQIFVSPILWPERIIIMSLPRVGSDQGPDVEKLQQFTQRYPEHVFIAAGGIRNSEDIAALSKIGITTALLASALHAGTIGAQDLQQIAS